MLERSQSRRFLPSLTLPSPSPEPTEPSPTLSKAGDTVETLQHGTPGMVESEGLERNGGDWGSALSMARCGSSWGKRGGDRGIGRAEEERVKRLWREEGAGGELGQKRTLSLWLLAHQWGLFPYVGVRSLKWGPPLPTAPHPCCSQATTVTSPCGLLDSKGLSSQLTTQ